jgi:flagella basal body P-ring formation protein FlgA
MTRFALFACTALFAGSALAAQPVTLKPEPVDSDGVVTLGDLFDGAGAASATVVAPGPARGLRRRARRRPCSSGRPCGRPAVGQPDGMRRIAVRAGGAPTTAAPGSRAGMVEALVYARSLNAGETLRAEDLTWGSIASHLVPADAPRDAESAMGKAARKAIRAGAPVAARDLASARVIAKDETVSVAYRVGGVNLVLQGKALGSASGRRHRSRAQPRFQEGVRGRRLRTRPGRRRPQRRALALPLSSRRPVTRCACP